MRRKWKIWFVLAGVAVAFGAIWLWPSGEPVYEGKRLSEWLDEGMRLAPHPYVTNHAVEHVVKSIQTIGTNAIPFLVRDLQRQESRWVKRVKDLAGRLKLMDESHGRSWRLERSVWGFEALGTNAAPALERLLALLDDKGTRISGVKAALTALGPVAVPDLVKRLRATNWMTSVRATETLRNMGYNGGPGAETAIPLLVAMLDDANTLARQQAVLALMAIKRQPERLVPLFRGLLGDSNNIIRMRAARGLTDFGPHAKEAIPDLLRAANDSDRDVSNAVREALQKIESETSKAPSR